MNPVPKLNIIYLFALISITLYFTKYKTHSVNTYVFDIYEVFSYFCF